jgi:hypothetical protein
MRIPQNDDPSCGKDTRNLSNESNGPEQKQAGRNRGTVHRAKAGDRHEDER